MEVMRERIILNNKAHQNPSTLNPFTNFATSKIIKALITSRKKPKDKIVTGIVRIISIGLIKIFKKDNTIATRIAVVKPSI
jgi:hypothetical protein